MVPKNFINTFLELFPMFPDLLFFKKLGTACYCYFYPIKRKYISFGTKWVLLNNCLYFNNPVFLVIRLHCKCDKKISIHLQGNNYLFKIGKKTLEKVRNMFKVNNKDTRTTSVTSFWCFY